MRNFAAKLAITATTTLPAFVECGNITPITNNSYHTPFITPLPAQGVYQPDSYAATVITPILSPPLEYMICLVKSKNKFPLITGVHGISPPPEYSTPGREVFSF